ncbi:amine oxidase, flavin-containing [Cystobacter fuscus]|uniref:Amine oxidase, flavin-containing n=1 Tax=Cystobacter fuscus TaxID=43 RepID=A0A250J3R9_9BACT|nr:FAD-dependent oxidoreductase [Cystobacter fuscus]ATB38619.1 amine oxidase, flavin-containing [Cystobacter fuscus]
MASSSSSDLSTSRFPRVAVIGAGLAGLTLARILTEMGLSVNVFDKGRSPAGRMSTRHEAGGSFDHGAQYFTARDEGFQRQVETWVEQGIAAEWRGRFGTLENGTLTPKDEGPVRYVGVPGMSALAQAFASRVDVRCGVRVEHVRREHEAWALTSDTGEALGAFHAVVAAVPAPQAVPLLAGSPELSARVAGVRMEPCWSVMAGFAAPVPLPVDGAFIHGSPLSWASRDNSKPGRPEGERWVLHATPDFSREHLEDSPEAVAPLLVEAFSRAAGVDVRPVRTVAHRWRYAQAESPLTEGALFDDKRGLGACGDWCAGSRVEGAYLSAMALSRRIVFWRP